MSEKVRVVVELDRDLATQIDEIRGEVELSKMLGVIIKLGFNVMRELAKQGWKGPKT
jgi:hypothetical protein